MSPVLHEFLSLDLPAMLTGVLAALACGLLGNFLLLRRLSLMGDAVAHSVLPGLVAGFLIAGSRASLPMFLGAAAAGVITALLIELIRRAARLDTGAAMGVVFTILFALGVLLIEQAAARGIDLDPDCVLNGQLETIFWMPPVEWSEFWTLAAFCDLPREMVTLALITALVIAFIALLFKELRLAAFDPALATALGFRAGALHLVQMIFVAGAVVASFEAVGSILVIAMLICPAATARLLTDRLSPQIWISAGIAAITGIAGYALATWVPRWAGASGTLNVAGMMTTVAGALVAFAIVASPTHGVVARRLRLARWRSSIIREDVAGLLYRREERGEHDGLSIGDLASLLGRTSGVEPAVRAAARRGELTLVEGRARLTPRGRRGAASIIRAHRLWESFLVNEAGLRPDHVHRTAMDLEHLGDEQIRALLAQRAEVLDPHERPIPRDPGAAP